MRYKQTYVGPEQYTVFLLFLFYFITLHPHTYNSIRRNSLMKVSLYYFITWRPFLFSYLMLDEDTFILKTSITIIAKDIRDLFHFSWFLPTHFCLFPDFFVFVKRYYQGITSFYVFLCVYVYVCKMCGVVGKNVFCPSLNTTNGLFGDGYLWMKEDIYKKREMYLIFFFFFQNISLVPLQTNKTKYPHNRQ